MLNRPPIPKHLTFVTIVDVHTTAAEYRYTEYSLGIS